jgi:hypothetical protein
MSDDGSFLARWSRRKRAAAEAVEARDESPVPAEPTEPAALEAEDGQGPGASQESGGPEPAEVMAEPVDLAALPPIETIGPDTDVTAFLREGVPRALREAALSRVWSSDPVISRFVEMADYAWDWNTPGGAPGYGPLDPDVDVAGLVEGIVKGTKALLAEADERVPVAAQQGEEAAHAERPAAEPQISAEVHPCLTEVSEGLALCDATMPRFVSSASCTEISVAGGRTSADTAETGRFPVKRHGKALPA